MLNDTPKLLFERSKTLFFSTTGISPKSKRKYELNCADESMSLSELSSNRISQTQMQWERKFSA